MTSTLPRFLRTGVTFFIQAEFKIKAMLQAFSVPTLFITLTFFEQWSGYRHILNRTGNRDTLPSNRPWDAVQYFYQHIYWLKREFLRKEAISVFGKLCKIIE